MHNGPFNEPSFFHALALRCRRHYVFGLSVHPLSVPLSVRPSVCLSIGPKPEIPSFHLYMGPFVHLTNYDRFAACQSVRPERFPGICGTAHGGRKFCMLMYLDHLQNWLDKIVILALFWLSEMGQIWVSGHFLEELVRLWLWSVESSNVDIILT